MNNHRMIQSIPIFGAWLIGVWLIMVAGFNGALAEVPAHHGDGVFRNPYLSAEQKPSLGRYLWMRMTDSQAYADWDGVGGQVPQQALVPEDLEMPDEGSARISWLGHSTFLIQYQGLNILTDPIFSQRCSPVSWAGPERVLAPAIDIHQLPPIDLVIISHSHYDHLDLDSIQALKEDTHFYVPLALKDWFIDEGFSESQVTELDWWEGIEHGPLWLKAAPSQHFSGRTPFNFNETLWASWALIFKDLRIWFAGDTGYNAVQFKEIGERLGPVDLALIPIGAYEPRWFMKPQHVNPEEAVQIALDIKAKLAIGMHWGTFQLSAEAILDPIKDLEEARQKLKVSPEEFRVMALGEQLQMKGKAQDQTLVQSQLSQPQLR